MCRDGAYPLWTETPSGVEIIGRAWTSQCLIIPDEKTGPACPKPHFQLDTRARRGTGIRLVKTGIMKNPVREVLKVYGEIDGRIRRFKMATGLRCPMGCGLCCAEHWVETSVLEALPLAVSIYSLQQEEEILERIEERMNRGETLCVLYRPNPEIPGRGRCTHYSRRPLLCRMFGFATRRGKNGLRELSSCRIIREKSPDVLHRAEEALTGGLDLPVYQDCHMEMISIDITLARRVLPINEALKEAVEYLYWKRPRRRKRIAV